ncbi:7414_t:CDS:2 [Paraglomus brasilianum]|uniref:7414_t:CDS:1 n=1 Tax=Paraglomus brasilianum TaxID=144538 RepID=A0A9N8ZTY0_9GLOM|nr:7414_t:CDS:2 [Paraglomus brasilianum]
MEPFESSFIPTLRTSSRTNTVYALRLRKAEVEIQKLVTENFELRAVIAQLKTEVSRLKTDKDTGNKFYQNTLKSSSDKITSILHKLHNAVDALNVLVDEDVRNSQDDKYSWTQILDENFQTSEGYRSTTNSNLDKWTEKVPEKRKLQNPISSYIKDARMLASINETAEEQSTLEERVMRSTQRQEPSQLQLQTTEFDYQTTEFDYIPSQLNITYDISPQTKIDSRAIMDDLITAVRRPNDLSTIYTEHPISQEDISEGRPEQIKERKDGIAVY